MTTSKPRGSGSTGTRNSRRIPRREDRQNRTTRTATSAAPALRDRPSRTARQHPHRRPARTEPHLTPHSTPTLVPHPETSWSTHAPARAFSAPRSCAPPSPAPRSAPLGARPHSRAESFSSPVVTSATQPPAAPNCWSTRLAEGLTRLGHQVTLLCGGPAAVPRLPRRVGGRRPRSLPARPIARSTARSATATCWSRSATACRTWRRCGTAGRPCAWSTTCTPTCGGCGSADRWPRPPGSAEDSNTGRWPAHSAATCWSPSPRRRHTRCARSASSATASGSSTTASRSPARRPSARRSRCSWRWAGSSSTSGSICCCGCGSGSAR